MRDRLRYLEEALREIAKGNGAFSREPLQHAENVIESARRTATEALVGQWRPSDEFIESQRDSIPTNHPCMACGDAIYHRARERAFSEAVRLIRAAAGHEYADGNDHAAKALRESGVTLAAKMNEEIGFARSFELSESHMCAGKAE